MTRIAFTGARIFDGERLLDHHHLVVDSGRIVSIGAGEPEVGAEIRRLDGGILSPGFIDVQVNGGGGILLNDEPTREGMARIAAAHRPFGTTALLPTLITDTPEQTKAVLDAASAGPIPGVAGIHLEGPHLDPDRKGAHLAELMYPVGDREIALYSRAAALMGTLVVTLAANQASPATVRALTDGGVIVSIGHSECTANEAEALFDAGARGVTHLYNAMSALGHRQPGLVGAALSRDDVWGGIICDGHHVDPRALKIAFRAKGTPGRLFVVTDAMALVGSDRETFTLNGRQVKRDASGYCPRLTLDDGTLAGSDIDMASSLRFLIEKLGMPLEDVLRRATADPADFLRQGKKRGRLVAGARADLVHLSGEIHVRSVWLAEDL
jgi:N-acetylglucosamine-6-phosphate deacetylase